MTTVASCALASLPPFSSCVRAKKKGGDQILAGQWEGAVAAHAGVPASIRSDLNHVPRSITIVAANKTAAEKWYYEDSVGAIEFPGVPAMSLADFLSQILGWAFFIQQGDMRW